MLTDVLFLVIGIAIGYIIKQRKQEADHIFIPAPVRAVDPKGGTQKTYDPLKLLDPQYTLEMDENGDLYSPYEDLYKEEHKKESAWKDNDPWDWENNEKERSLWH